MLGELTELSKDYVSESTKNGKENVPTSNGSSNSPELNENFLNGKNIHREVPQREISKFLGLKAMARPAKYNVLPLSEQTT